MRANREGIVPCDRCGMLRIARQVMTTRCPNCARMDVKRYLIARGAQ